MRNSTHSPTALTLPGRLTISVLPLIPAVPLLSQAVFTFSEDLWRSISGIPGTFLSETLQVASGVKSLGLKPVPPVVRSRSVPGLHKSVSADDTGSIPSSVSLCSTSEYPASSRSRTITGPLPSSLSPRLQLSLTVSTLNVEPKSAAALIVISFNFRNVI